MKIELRSILEVIEEKENQTEHRVDELNEFSNFYYHEIGRLGALRELESLVRDLLEE